MRTSDLILGMLLMAAGQEPPPADPVQTVLAGIKQRAEAQARDDQRRALLLIQQAQTAERAGRLDEALKFAEKAAQLFPDSAEIKQAHRHLLAEQRQQRQRDLNLGVAVAHVEEAVAFLGVLTRENRHVEARELAEAVLEAAKKFPAAVDLKLARAAADQFLAEQTAKMQANLPVVKPKELPPEPLPVPLRSAPDTSAKQTAARHALAQTLSVDWRDEPLASVLGDIERETGVTVAIDPALERLRAPAARKVDLRLHHVRAERLLRLVTEMTETGYIVAEGQIILTTREKALQYTVAQSRGETDPRAVKRLLCPELPWKGTESVKPTEFAAAREPLLPPPSKAPAYLQSDQAFLEHIEELLKPLAEKKPEP